MAPPPRTRGWVIGRAWGARIVLQPWTLLMIVVLAFIFGMGADNQITGEGMARGGALVLLLFASVLLHELGHAGAARAFKREVREIVITLWGGHTEFDSKDITPKVAGITAFAGPAVNAVVAGIAWAVLAAPLPSGVEIAMTWLAIVNVVLAAFNALPGIPMDGGRVLEAIVWKATGKRTTGMVVAAWTGRAIALSYLGWVAYDNFGRGRPADMFAVVWALLIFSILWPAAGAALRAARLLDRIDVATAARLMRGAMSVSYEYPLDEALREAEAAGVDEIVVLAVDGKPAGHVPVAIARGVPREKRAETPLSAVTIPVPRGAEVDSALAGHELLVAAREWWGRTDALVVVDGGEVVGVVVLGELSDRLSGRGARP